ncbi:MAG: sensor histidine kinase [Flavisolibacter sp.]
MAEYQKRRRQYMEEKKQFHEELLRTQLEIKEQTLKNISQEIHDNIGQTLSLVKLNLNTMDLKKAEALEQKIGYSKELVSKAIIDLRDISRSLNTDSILSAGLLKAIESELTMLEKAGVYSTELLVKGPSTRLDEKKELILFRIVQEAIQNIIKHANATHIDVKAEFSSQQFTVSVEDNGKGIQADRENSEGSGLRNMKSRALLIGGNFEIQSNHGGTQIKITVPITQS